MSHQVGCIEFVTQSPHSSDNTTLRKDIYLPKEIISEILSWLPVKSILRFKCACNLWLSITLDSEFIHKHMMRTTETIWSNKEEVNGQYIRSMSRGLFLERTSPSSNYRVRNPMTRRVFDLPDSGDNNELYHLMLLCYVSETRTFKVAFPSPNGKNGKGCFKILSIGVDEKWRTIDFPLTSSEPTKAKDPDNALKDVYVSVVLPRSREYGEPALVCLELESEKTWRSSIPKDFIKNLMTMDVVIWHGKPSLVGRKRGDNHRLHILALEDYKKEKWAKNAIVKGSCDTVLRDVLAPYYYPDLYEDYRAPTADDLRFCVAFNIVTKVATTPRTWVGFRVGNYTQVQYVYMIYIV